jgi:hypothetical protein
LEQVRLAGALQAMPHARDALASGEVSTSSLRVLASAREAHPEAFAGDEARLVEAARALPVRHLERTVAGWRLKQDERDPSGEAERLWRPRRPVLQDPPRHGAAGRRPRSGHRGERAHCPAGPPGRRGPGEWGRRRPHPRPANGRRPGGDLSSVPGPGPSARGGRGAPPPHGDGGPGGPGGAGGWGSRFDHTGPVGAETARRLGCDASVTRVVTRGRSEPLDVGRQTPVVSAAMRRALVVRDGGCAFPACDRPPPWTDAHHVVHWARGGRTALSNLVLLCRPHHRVVHEGGFGLDMVEGRPLF